MWQNLLWCGVASVAILVAGCGDGDDGGSGSGSGSNGTATGPAAAFKLTHPRVTNPPAPEDVAITVATGDKCEITDPHNTESGGDVKVIINLYETLVRVDPETPDRLIPWLAESWTVADDGLAIEFEIKEGVKFHDGTPLDGEAVKLSLQRLVGDYLDAPAAPYRGLFDFITEIDAEGMTVTIYMDRPVARVALRNLSMFPAGIVSPSLMQATEGMGPGERTTFISEWACGTGPYFLDKLDAPAARVRLRAFADYHGGKPAIDKIVYRQIPDKRSQIEYLKAGEADMLDDTPRESWDTLEQTDSIHLQRWWALNICYLGVNVGHEKTKDFKVRRAIQLAIDRDALAELYYGTARPSFSLIAQPSAEYDPDYRAPGTDAAVADRQAKARELITEAGAAGREMNIYYPMHPRPYLPTPEKVADKIRQQLDAVGLKVNIMSVPNNELFESVRNDSYELILIGWTSDNGDPDNFYLPLTTGDPKTGKPSPLNAGRTFDPQIHKTLIDAQAITDAAKRVEVYRQVERQWQEQHIGYVPLVNTQQAYAYTQRLKDVEVDPLSNYRFHKARVSE